MHKVSTALVYKEKLLLNESRKVIFHFLDQSHIY